MDFVLSIRFLRSFKYLISKSGQDMLINKSTYNNGNKNCDSFTFLLLNDNKSHLQPKKMLE